MILSTGGFGSRKANLGCSFTTAPENGPRGSACETVARLVNSVAIVGGQHRSAYALIAFIRSSNAEEFGHQRGIQPAAKGFQAHDSESLFTGQRGSVGAVDDQRVIDVRDLQDTRFRRDLGAAQTVGIAAA